MFGTAAVVMLRVGWVVGEVLVGDGSAWVWLEVDESAPCGQCIDATRAVRSWRDCEQ